SRLGIDGDKQVVAYDDSGGAIAARLWWLLRYMSHPAVAVLDGGWQAWQAAGLPFRTGIERNNPAEFLGWPRWDRVVLLDEVPQVERLIDSRAPERYRGDHEPLDRRAGHIPGAVNHHFSHNLDENGRFRLVRDLYQNLQQVLGDTPPDEAVFYCGSGVTAAHNVLAAVHAGLPEPRLYAGSWSEGSRDPDRPVEGGDGGTRRQGEAG